MIKKICVVLISSFLLAGCDRAYEKTGVGKFEGVLEVRWLEPDKFLFVPNEKNPLRYTTADATWQIKPKPMYTDGGSIPRIFWSVPGYSPWGVAPAYIIHDWLFVAHHCNSTGYENVSFSDTSRIMGESIKTLMETNIVPKDETLFFAVVAAVKTPIAESLWKNGECDLPPEILAYGTVADVRKIVDAKYKEINQALIKENRKLRSTSDKQLTQRYAEKVTKLEKKQEEVHKISAATADKSEDAPATKLVYSIDIGAIQ
jgi:hypothetical protein